ncbi:MAG: MBL fold metallo-hydrolase [Vicinamibacterales bacterium]
MSRTAVLTGIVLAGVVAVAGRSLVAQQPPAGGPNVAGIEKVKDNLYMVTGGGGNTAVFVTANGVVLVDTKLANWGPAIMDKVKTVTDKPVTHIINTHTHGDHVGSNEYFPASVEIVAHANVSTSMAKMPAFADGTKKHAFPDRTYTDRMTVLSGADAIDLYHFGAAHTNGDTFVVFRNLRTMHSGDAFSAKGTPLIDVNNGGTGVAYPDTIAKVVAGVKNVDTVIPGHSTVMTWQDLVEFGDFTRAFLTAVQTAKKAGKTADQAAAELSLPDRFKAYTMTRAKDNVATIYKQLP